LGDPWRATDSNSESEAIQYHVGCLRRWLVRWEQEVQLKLIAPSERAIQDAEFLPDAILRGDITSRYTAYRTGRDGGWLSVNDIRRMENLPAIGRDGDTYLRPLSMQVIGGGRTTRTKATS
jgi:phage portal protein BeeE